jgi:hypothetical protein
LQRIPFRGFGPDRGTSAAEEADSKRWQPGVIPALKKSLSLRDHAVAGRSRASPWMIIEPLPSMQYRRARSTALCSNGKHRVNKWLTPPPTHAVRQKHPAVLMAKRQKSPLNDLLTLSSKAASAAPVPCGSAGNLLNGRLPNIQSQSPSPP